MRIYHRSTKKGLTIIDPKYYGSGKKGAERSRILESGIQESSWYVGRPSWEPGLGKEVYKAVISANKIYNVPQGSEFNPSKWIRQSYIGFRVGNEVRLIIVQKVEYVGTYKLGKRLPLVSIYESTVLNGGATWNPINGEFVEAKGFAVGMMEGTFRIVEPHDYESFKLAVKDVLRCFPDCMVGTWRNPKGEYEVDPSIIVGSRSEAERLASKHNQKAYYDFAAGESVFLNGG